MTELEIVEVFENELSGAVSKRFVRGERVSFTNRVGAPTNIKQDQTSKWTGPWKLERLPSMEPRENLSSPDDDKMSNSSGNPQEDLAGSWIYGRSFSEIELSIARGYRKKYISDTKKPLHPVKCRRWIRTREVESPARDGQIIMSGFAGVRNGPGPRDWRNRYFKFENGLLKCFLSDDVSEPVSQIQLTTNSSVRSGKFYRFVIDFDENGARKSVEMNADDAATKDRWVETLNLYLKSTKPEVSQQPTPVASAGPGNESYKEDTASETIQIEACTSAVPSLLELQNKMDRKLEMELGVGIEKFFQLFMADNATFGVQQFHDVLSYEDTVIQPWTRCTQLNDGSYRREVTAVAPVDSPMPPDRTKLTKRQVYKYFPGKLLVQETESHSHDVTHGDRWYIFDRWIVESLGENKCRFTIYGDVIFTKSSLLKSLIRKSATANAQACYDTLQQHFERVASGCSASAPCTAPAPTNAAPSGTCPAVPCTLSAPTVSELQGNLQLKTEMNVNVGLERFFELFVADNATFGVMQFQDLLKYSDSVSQPWQADKDGICRREVTSIAPVDAPMPPDRTKLTKRQLYKYFPSKLLIQETESHSHDVTHGDRWHIFDRWIVEAVDENHCKFAIYGDVIFTKSSLLKSLIRKSATSNAQMCYDLLVEQFKKYTAGQGSPGAVVTSAGGDEVVVCTSAMPSGEELRKKADAKLDLKLEISVNVGVEDFFKMFVSDSASYGVLAFEKDLKYENSVSSGWSPCGELNDGTCKRQVTSVAPVDAPMPPDRTKLTKRQLYKYFPSKLLIQETESHSHDVTHGDRWYIFDRWVVEAIDESHCKMSIYGDVIFTKSSLLKSLIRKNATSNAQACYDLLGKSIQDRTGSKGSGSARCVVVASKTTAEVTEKQVVAKPSFAAIPAGKRERLLLFAQVIVLLIWMLN